MKIAIIGQGYVGKAIKGLFEGYYETITYDPKLNPEYPKDAIDKCKLAIVCVPTPMSEGGKCDTSYSRVYCGQIEQSSHTNKIHYTPQGQRTIYVIKQVKIFHSLQSISEKAPTLTPYTKT